MGTFSAFSFSAISSSDIRFPSSALIFFRDVVTLVAEPVREPDVVGGEMTSVHLQSRIVVGRRLPIGTRRSRVEVPTTPEAVALGHLAAHVDELAIPGKLPEDSANSQGL